MESNSSAIKSLALAVLEIIAVNEEVSFLEQNFMQLLMVPLIRRLRARRVDPNRVRQIVQIVQLAVKYLQGHEHARTQLSLAGESLICYVADYWSYASSLFEECLADLVGLRWNDSHGDLSCHQNLLHQVNKTQRYEVLKIICLHSLNVRVDIESDDELKIMLIEK